MGNGKMGKSSSSGGSQITNAARRQLPGGENHQKRKPERRRMEGVMSIINDLNLPIWHFPFLF